MSLVVADFVCDLTTLDHTGIEKQRHEMMRLNLISSLAVHVLCYCAQNCLMFFRFSVAAYCFSILYYSVPQSMRWTHSSIEQHNMYSYYVLTGLDNAKRTILAFFIVFSRIFTLRSISLKCWQSRKMQK